MVVLNLEEQAGETGGFGPADHLRVLVEAGILRRRRDGRRIIYAIVSSEMAGRLRRVGVAPPVAAPELEGRIRDFLASQ